MIEAKKNFLVDILRFVGPQKTIQSIDLFAIPLSLINEGMNIGYPQPLRCFDLDVNTNFLYSYC